MTDQPKYGIDEALLHSLIELFKKNGAVEQAILFGSRAKGNYHAGSDIDLTVTGKNLSFDDYLALNAQINGLDTLYTIDLIRYESIDSAELKEHIKRVGIVLYQKDILPLSN